MISIADARCQGRAVRVLGGATLARECTNCQRRTDIPADMQSIVWMQPPVIRWSWEECPSAMPPEPAEEITA
jgi:hypothetical protein